MAKAKPIFLLGIPDSDIERRISINNELSKRMPDYHVIAYNSPACRPEFQVLNPTILSEIQFKELKEYVLSQLKNP